MKEQFNRINTDLECLIFQVPNVLPALERDTYRGGHRIPVLDIGNRTLYTLFYQFLLGLDCMALPCNALR